MSTVAIGQFSTGEDKTANLRKIEHLAQTAAENGAKMLFLPEYSMYYAKVNARSKNIEAAEPCDGPFIIALGELCRRYGLWIAAGMYERTDGLPYNTIVVLDDRGRLRGTHRKNRLYDAFGYRESDKCRAGDKPFSPIETPVGKLGIITCFELRFPARAAEQHRRAVGRECRAERGEREIGERGKAHRLAPADGPPRAERRHREDVAQREQQKGAVLALHHALVAAEGKKERVDREQGKGIEIGNASAQRHDGCPPSKTFSSV